MALSAIGWRNEAIHLFEQAEALLAAGQDLAAHEMFSRAGAAAAIATAVASGTRALAPRQAKSKRS